MKVYTYYMPVPQLHDEKSQRALLKVWERSWRKAGWEPIVLTEHNLVSSPSYSAIKRKFWSLPTEYGHDYEGACFMRWATVAHLGGGMLTDYDVINYGFEPIAADPHKMQIFCDSPPNCVFMGAVLGIREHFQEMTDIFLGWRPDEHDVCKASLTWRGKSHCSDLSMLVRMFEAKTRAKPPWLVKVPGCALYPNPSWKKSSLVHYGFEMKRDGYWPKADWIEKLRPF